MNKLALVAVALLAVMVLAAFSGIVPVQARSAPSASSLSKIEKNPQWSGYADLYKNKSVTMVETSFILPSVTCNASSPTEQETFFFAALDNLVKSNDFEYAGALAYCPVGVSTPYYYAINTVNFTIASWTPNAGDKIFASITVSKGNFVYNVKDETSHESTIVKASTKGAALNSAEVLTDTGNCGNATVVADCPLVNFGKVLFGFGHTQIPNTSYATIDGITMPIGSFSSPVRLYKGITTNENGTIVDSATSRLSSSNSSFFVKYENSGP